jgi:adenylate cyclase
MNMMRRAPVSETLLDKVSLWLQEAALNGEGLETLVQGFCERLAASGMPLLRVHLSFSVLHPLYDALGFTWIRGQGTTVEGYQANRGEDDNDRFLKSPYFYLLSHNLGHLRRHITPETPNEFPIFEHLKEIGVTDYIAFVQSFAKDTNQGMIGSWATDAPQGFDDAVIAALMRIQSNLAVAAKMAVLSKLANNMLTTYLGGNAGQRVLSGQIRRGDGESIRAALVMVDMRGSTLLAEREGRQVYIDTLNQFFDAVAMPFNRNGGEILSFVGDGFLAIYPCGRHREPSEYAAQAAMNATRQAVTRMEELNADRERQSLAPVRYGVGLHMGNVMFGNVGLRDRLTFSAFGASVNEVHRLQGLTKKFGKQVLASGAFVNYCGGNWLSLGEEPLRGIRQKVKVLEPTQDFLELNQSEVLESRALDARSEAEQVMLLYRSSQPHKTNSPWERLTQ